MYMRKAYIEVFDKKDDMVPSMVIDGLRITGEIQYQYDSSDVTARLVVYNLSLKNRKALLVRDESSRNPEPTGIQYASHYIKLYVGHVDEHFVGGKKSLILQGPAINIFHFSKRPNVHTVMYVVPSGKAAALNQIEPFAAWPSMTLSQALKELGRRGGYSAVDTSRLLPHIADAPMLGNMFGLEKSLQTEMLKLGNTYNFMTRYSAGKMVVKMKSSLPSQISEEVRKLEENRVAEVDENGMRVIRITRGRDIYKITTDMVRENPRVGSKAVDIVVTLAPELEHVELIDLSEVAGQLILDGMGDPLYRDPRVREYMLFDIYRVGGIIHIFDTHGQTWNTHISAHYAGEGYRVKGN